MNIKKGDYVKVIKKGSYWNSVGEMDYLLNRIVKIDTLNLKSLIMMCDNISHYAWSFNLNDVIPSTEEEYKKQCKQDKIEELERELKELKS